MLDVIEAYGTTDAANTRYQYDALGLKTAEIDPRGVELSEKDSAWALAQRKALGYVDNITGNAKLASALSSAEKTALLNLYTTRTLYDVLGRKSQSTDAMGGITRTAYDSFNNVIKITDPQGNAAYLYYDKRNHQTGYVNPEG